MRKAFCAWAVCVLVAGCASGPAPTPIGTIASPASTPVLSAPPPSATSGPTASETPPPGPGLARVPGTEVWFSPFPSDLGTALGLPIGSTDYRALFDAGAPWSRVAAAVDVFEYPWQWLVPDVIGLDDAELQREVAAVRAHGLQIAMSWEPLVATDCGQGIEGFYRGPDGAIEAIQRIVDAGGIVSAISLDEEFQGGSLSDGPTACRWTIERTAREVAAFVRGVHARFPGVSIGDTEPWPAVSSAQILGWLDAYRAAAGSPLPSITFDIDWMNGPADWPTQVLALEQAVRDRGTRFGIIYNGQLENDSSGWLAAARTHMEAYELAGGRPDVAVFASWYGSPQRVLPEDDSTTFTHLVADYFRPRPSMSLASAAPSSGRVALAGTIRLPDGAAVAGAGVAFTAIPRDGQVETIELRGTIPAGVTRALVGIRTNEEGAGPGPAKLTFYEVGYAEETGRANLVPNGRFGRGAWDYLGTGSLRALPSDRGRGTMLRLVATARQTVMANSAEFGVTSGAAYRLWLTVRIPESSAHSTVIDLIFIAPAEAGRARLAVVPGPFVLGSTSSDAAGTFRFVAHGLERGRYWFIADVAGDAARWPVRTRTPGTVR